MGIISDTWEDNAEKLGQFLTKIPSNHSVTAGRTYPLLACPICADVVKQEVDLQRHILQRHRHLQVYVKLNGSVVPEVAFVDEDVSDLRVVLIGESPGTVQISLDERELPCTDIMPGKPMSLETHVPAHFIGKVTIDISIGKLDREVVIYCRTQPSLAVRDLDEAIWDLQLPLTQGKEPDWSQFQRNYLQDQTRNSLERRYLLGFYDYLLGCYLESERPLQAGKHLEEAVGCLRPFTTTLASTARHILALKLNAFRLLKDCGPESRFYDASIFFNEGGVGVLGERLVEGGSPSNRGLYADEYVERLLDAVAHFNRGEFDQVETTVASIRQLHQFQEPNNRDKVILLKARAARALNQRQIAMRAYVQLFHHPLFGREAESYCE